MTAIVTSRRDWAVRKIEKDLAAFLDDRGPDLEKLHLARLVRHCNIPADDIKWMWAVARKEKAEPWSVLGKKGA
jgi:hypothetical protein